MPGPGDNFGYMDGMGPWNPNDPNSLAFKAAQDAANNAAMAGAAGGGLGDNNKSANWFTGAIRTASTLEGRSLDENKEAVLKSISDERQKIAQAEISVNAEKYNRRHNVSEAINGTKDVNDLSVHERYLYDQQMKSSLDDAIANHPDRLMWYEADSAEVAAMGESAFNAMRDAYEKGDKVAYDEAAKVAQANLDDYYARSELKAKPFIDAEKNTDENIKKAYRDLNAAEKRVNEEKDTNAEGYGNFVERAFFDQMPELSMAANKIRDIAKTSEAAQINAIKFAEGSDFQLKFFAKMKAKGFTDLEVKMLWEREKAFRGDTKYLGAGTFNIRLSKLMQMNDDNGEDIAAINSFKNSVSDIQGSLKELKAKKAVLSEPKHIKIQKRADKITIKRQELEAKGKNAKEKIEKLRKKETRLKNKAARSKKASEIKGKLETIFRPGKSYANSLIGRVKEAFFAKTAIGKAITVIAQGISTFIFGTLLPVIGGAFLAIFSILCGITAIIVILFFISGLLNYSISPSETAHYILYRSLYQRENDWKTSLEDPEMLFQGVKDGDFRFGRYYMRWEDYASMKPHMIYFDERTGFGLAGDDVRNKVYINPLDFVPAYPGEYFTAIGDDVNWYSVMLDNPDWFESKAADSIDWDDAEEVQRYCYAYDEEYYYTESPVDGVAPFIKLPFVATGYDANTADPNNDGHYEFDTLYAYTGPTWDDGTPFTPGAFGDAGIMVNYLPNISASAEYGNGGHTSNIKDILCMMDVMFQFEGHSDSQTTEDLGLDSDPLTLAADIVFDLVCNALKLLHNWFLTVFMGEDGDVYKWPLDADLEDYKRMRSYCQVLFEASHQEMLDIDVILFDCTKEPGSEGYLMTDDEELGRADALDDAYLGTHLGSLLHSGCPAADIGGCAESKFYGVVYNSDNPDLWSSASWESGLTMEDYAGNEGYFTGWFEYSDGSGYYSGDIYHDPYGLNDTTGIETALDRMNIQFGLGTNGYGWTYEYEDPADPTSAILSAKVDIGRPMLGVVGKLDKYYNNVPRFKYLTFVDTEDNFGEDSHPYCLPVNLRNALTAANTFPESSFISNGRGNLRYFSEANMMTLWDQCGGDPAWEQVDGEYVNNGGCWVRIANVDEKTLNFVTTADENNVGPISWTTQEQFWPANSLAITCAGSHPECDEGDEMSVGDPTMPSGPYVNSESGYRSSLLYDTWTDGDGPHNDRIHWNTSDGSGNPGKPEVIDSEVDFVDIRETDVGQRIVLGWYDWTKIGDYTVTCTCTGHTTSENSIEYCSDETITLGVWKKTWTFYVWGTSFYDNTGVFDNSTGLDGAGTATLGKMLPVDVDKVQDDSKVIFDGNNGSIKSFMMANGNISDIEAILVGNFGTTQYSAGINGTTCAGHTCRFCGGHTLVDVKGIVFSFTDEEIVAAGGKTGGRTTVQAGDYEIIPVYNQECIDARRDTPALLAYYSNVAASAAGASYNNYNSDPIDESFMWSNHISSDPEESLFARPYYQNVGVHGMNMQFSNGSWVGTNPDVSASVMEKLESVRTYPDGFTWGGLTRDDDYEVNRMLWYAQDIFDIDAIIDYPYGFFPIEEAKEYQGWTQTNMTLALTKYIMSWEDVYYYDIPVNFGSPQLSDAQISDILKAIGGSSLGDRQKDAVIFALQAVGNGQYSQEHHSHGYLMYPCSRYSGTGSALDELNGLHTHTCTCTDASGFASYIMNVGEQGSVWSTDDFYGHATPWSGWNSGSGALQPGDIVIHYPVYEEGDWESYGQDGGHHVMVYIGTPSEDINLTWMDRNGRQTFAAYDADGNPIYGIDEETGEPNVSIGMELDALNGGSVTFKARYYITLKAGEPIFVDCTRLDQDGGIYLRGGYACSIDPTESADSGFSEDTSYFYMADDEMMGYVMSGSDMYKYRPSY